VKSTQVETDREYALVVDEEALKRPPIPQSESGEHFVPTAELERIRQLLNSDRYLDAYQEYARVLAEDRKRVMPSDLERSLGEFLMKVREYDRAAKVLGHHVASHPAGEISADTYFNLGYIHFMRRALDKARRFFKLFIKVERNPEYVARARRILEKIDGPGGAV
jgi:tetratricopeptide (TPR) repeat protein